MLKSIFLAGTLLVTSNFMPASPVTVPTTIAANIATPPTSSLTPTVAIVAPLLPPATSVKTFLPTDMAQVDASDGLFPEEREFIERINYERTSRDENALTLDPLLVQVARGHCRDMADNNYFDHASPTNGLRMPMDRYVAALHASGSETPNYALVGENIYYCSESNSTYDAAYGHQALMNSPGHRANILDPRFAKVGVGIYRNDRGEFWVTEMFLKDR